MQPITSDQLAQWGERYQASPERRLATLALSKSELNSVAFVNRSAGALRHKFSIDIKTMEVTDQRSSGRCWLFAATNVLRERIAQEKNLEAFELSQSYLAFWDKFERCNYLLQAVIDGDVRNEREELLGCLMKNE